MSIRHRFPGLSDAGARAAPQSGKQGARAAPQSGKTWARLDGAAGTLMADTAIDAMATFMRSPSASNLGGAFAASAACGELVDRARRAVGDLLGSEPDQVVFGPNSTTLMMAYTRALGRTIEPGDRIVCTQLDHDANISPWMQMATDRGAEVVLWPLAPSGNLDVDVLSDLLEGGPSGPSERETGGPSGRVPWVAVSGASNLTGAVPPIAEIVSLAHDRGARVHLDAVARVPHLATSHTAFGVDSLMSSAYKWFGPHVGALVLSAELLETVEPYRVRPADYQGAPRFETGTPAFESLAGVVGAAGFMAETSSPDTTAHEASLLARLETGLADIAGVTTYSPTAGTERAPTVIFNVEGHTPGAVAADLARHHVAVWHGHSYAIELIDALGLTDRGGAVRASIVRYNDESDIDRLLEAVAQR